MLKSMRSFLGLRKSIVAMLTMAILVGMGEKMAERFLPLYIMAMGGGAIVIGLLNGLDNLLSALYSIPGGYLSDKLGHRKALLIFNLMAILGYLIVIFVPTWQAVIVGSIFFLSWTAISLPATMSLVSASLPENKRAMGVSMHSLVRRIPMALGPVIGGLLIQHYGKLQGVRYSFMVAVAFAMVAIVVQQVYIPEPPKKPKDKERFRYRLPKPLQQLLISDILIRFCEQIPYAFVVIWVVENNGIGAAKFGALTAVEMVTAMLIYIPVAYLSDKGTKKPYIAITFVNFTLFPLLLMISRSFPMLILAFILRGLKEFGEPTRKALILDLAPPESKALSFGTYYFVRDVIVSVAAFGGAFLWQRSPQLNFLVAACFGALGTVFFIFKVKGKPDYTVVG